MKCFINPGHAYQGRPDPGAINPENGMREADVAAGIGGMVETYLREAGVETMLLQSHNLMGESRGLPCVVDTANGWGADIFVSIHCNGGGGRGCETLIFGAGGEREALAAAVQARVAQTIGDIDEGFRDRGLQIRPGLAVLRATQMPAILVETAFIDTQADAWLLYNYQDAFARAIACGVTDYQLDAIRRGVHY